ncbi:MAG: ferredoxin reductase family protein [Acidimicrobiales bacterium]
MTTGHLNQTRRIERRDALRYATSSPLTRAAQPTREALVGTVIGVGILLVCVMWWSDTTPVSLQGFGGWLTSAGRLTALVGTYLVVIEVLLMGRVAWLDRMIGMDRLAVWHRRNGELAVSLLVGHALFTIWGYAVTAHSGLIAETGSVVFTYPDMLAATVGLALLVAVGVLSARRVRRRVSYHTWYFIHLYTYVALALAFAHAFSTGSDFATHPLNRAAWIAMYAVVGCLLVTYRVGKPIRDALRHQLRVSKVAREGPGLTSIYVTGQRVGELRAQSGQFFMWRFLTQRGWWQAHPYSLSAAPSGDTLRLTVKELGDHSSELYRMRPGVRVMAEGPYGAFTARRRTRRAVVLIAGGVGITPIRALFENLPGSAGDVTLIYRARTPDEIAFRSELDTIATRSGARIHYLVGPSRANPEFMTPGHLSKLVPGIARHDAYVCGPSGMAEAAIAALCGAGVSRHHIYREDFEL